MHVFAQRQSAGAAANVAQISGSFRSALSRRLSLHWTSEAAAGATSLRAPAQRRPASLVANALRFTDIDDFSRQANALHVLVVFDSCFSGYSFQPLGRDAQLEQLRADGCAKVYREKASGAQPDRRELLRMLKDITPGDVVTVMRSAGAAPSTIPGMIRGHRKVGSERARGMNDALHGREAWRRPGKRDRDRRREVGSRVSAPHGGPGKRL